MSQRELQVPVAAYLPRSRVNGPGTRSVLWVQGCPLRCPGCFNQQFLEFTGGQPTPIEEVVGWICSQVETEGVTFSGGEPFTHASVLALVAEAVQKAGKSVVVFSGFTWASLKTRQDEGTRRLLAAADLLIAGPYLRDRPSQLLLRSSDNQELVFLSDRYRGIDETTIGRRSEYHILPNGEVTVSGFPKMVGVPFATQRVIQEKDL